MCRALSLAGLAALLALAVACGAPPAPTPKPTAALLALQVTSPAFAEGATIPEVYSCDGADTSPALRWSPVPAGTASIALTCRDPDAGGFVHWVLYGLPPSVTELAAGVPPSDTLPNGARQGINGFGRVGYGGPCPPAGKAHRYVFTLYALDAALDLPPKATQAQLATAMAGHILAEGQLVGQFSRR